MVRNLIIVWSKEILMMQIIGVTAEGEQQSKKASSDASPAVINVIVVVNQFKNTTQTDVRVHSTT